MTLQDHDPDQDLLHNYTLQGCAEQLAQHGLESFNGIVSSNNNNSLCIFVMQSVIMVQDQDSALQQSDLLLRLPEMSACFNKDSVEDIYSALKELDTEWSQATLKLLNGCVINPA